MFALPETYSYQDFKGGSVSTRFRFKKKGRKKEKEGKRRKNTCVRVFERLRLSEHNLRAQSLEHVLLLLSCAACITLTT
jgi:hypothetical protein